MWALFTVGHCHGQHYRLERFNARNGLLSDKTESVFQDKNGYIWIGTENGINRYDGYSFQSFLFAGDKNLGTIVSFVQDFRNTVWAAGSNGLFYFWDGSFHPFANGHLPSPINVLRVDKNGDLWAGSVGGLFKLPRKVIESRISPTLDELTGYSVLSDNVFALNVENPHEILLGSENGLEIMTSNERRCVWKQEGRYKVSEIVRLDSAILWTRAGNIPLIRKGNKISEYPTTDVMAKAIWNDGFCYLASTLGLERFQSREPERLIDFDVLYVTGLIIDREGNIWISTWEGLLKCREIPFKHYPPLGIDINDSYSMLRTRKGQLLIGSNHGMIFSRDGERSKTVFGKGVIAPNAELFDILEDHHDRIWIATGYQGISVIDGPTIYRITTANGLANNSVLFLHMSKSGTIWAGTENGLTEFSSFALTDQPRTYPFSLSGDICNLYTCFEMGGVAWLGGGKGLFRIDDGKLKKDSIRGLVQHEFEIRAAVIRDDEVWLATQGLGLLQCIVSNNKIELVKQWTVKDGLPSDVLLHIEPDDGGNIWISHYQGITRLQPESSGLISFTTEDGTSPQTYSDQKFFRDSDGTFWVYNTAGMYSFSPHHIKTNQARPLVTINGVVIRSSEYEVRMEPRHESDRRPAFSHKENSLRIHYHGTSLTNTEKNRYRYKLQGFNDVWHTTTSREVEFNKLSHGDYTFMVYASNNDGVWSVNPAEFTFSIEPPFWMTPTFYVLSASALVAVIVLVMQTRERRIKLMEAEKQRIAIMMAEYENKALRAQMNPHFIFNSLNAIQSCILMERTDAAFEYLNRFSRLLRLILSYSEKNLVPLNDEMKLIDLYVSLESLRFNDSFYYEVKVDPHLDAEEVMFPTMLTQPFIENAIWHGLLHKQGDKRLDIRFYIEAGELCCTVRDNGIGRTRASEIAATQFRTPDHESQGVNLTVKRATLLQALDIDVAINVEDIRGLEGEPAGTMVTIRTKLQFIK